MPSHFDILKRLIEGKVVAIVRLDSGEQLVKVAEALKAGGITVIEFTASTPGAIDMIKEAASRFGDEVLMGAGTVLDPETARAAILAGAEFIVTPTLGLETIKLCHRYGKPIVPGALTPTEILTAWEAGADMVKVFPSSVGGPGYIKALKGPLPQIPLVPVGGVNLDTTADFIRAGAEVVGVGGSLINQKLLDAGEFETITENARRYCEEVQKGRNG